MKPRTLLIGKSKRILSRLSSALQEEGCQTTWSSRVETVLDTRDPEAYDLVVTGRGIQLFDKKVLKEHFTSHNPEILFVDGLAPILPLLRDQIKLAWSSFARKKAVFSTLGFKKTPRGTQMHFQLEEPASLTLELYRLTFLYQTRFQTMTLDHIKKGAHDLLLPSTVFGKASPQFVVVKRSGEVLAAQAVDHNLTYIAR